ncbi:hypothetical protein K493DRAFT_338461 [Basidiobolus meristosporus CBS 931.73]|uniref:Calcineurin-like phosphoesterase domain-containing protein n=1 Tax=Basidiobolus meristosporus CBS 931.73 TaxID=1314790 RepID=A0A1Y1Y4Z4_9FUNG|nr:hypothetical protein K493DRAFT_338461 [Basidiobolus meristosporus CBS 931.73]|eukprot:ORX93101.1 hypothetical protein K493DRAFT_338461 [Basidiobolus meristosporus CBS 931.73]
MHIWPSLLTAFVVTTSYVDAFGKKCGGDVKMNLNPPDFHINRWKKKTEVPENLKVAFLGDQGLGRKATHVLKMIKKWGAKGAVHLGDFDYKDKPLKWTQQLDDVLGPDFPYFAVVGNHDILRWSDQWGYGHYLMDRLHRTKAMKHCRGELGVNMECYWNGLHIILSGVGTMGTGHVDYTEDAFLSSPAVWRLCAWHKNQRLLQTGAKQDETGYAIYEMCRKYGAMVLTGHVHSYSRTHLMSDFSKQTISDKNNTLHLRPGHSFVTVSGMGGKSIDSWINSAEKNEWWAAAASKSNGANYGALLCTFHINGMPNHAHCEFRDIDDKVWDSFDIISDVQSKESPDSLLLSQEQNKDELNFDTLSCQKEEFLEFALENAEDIISEHLTSGDQVCGSRHLNLAVNHNQINNQILQGLRFDQVGLSKEDKIVKAYLQVLASDKNADSERVITIDIRGEKTPNSSSFACGSSDKTASSRTLTQSTVQWVNEDEDTFENGEVWISPDIKDVIEEIVSQPDWMPNNALTLFLNGTILNAVEDSLYGFGWAKSGCFSPTLVVERELNC